MSHFIQFRYKWKNIIYGWLKLIATLTFIDLYRFILQAVSSLEGYRCFKLPTFIWLQFKYMNCLMRYKYIPKHISLKKSKLCTKYIKNMPVKMLQSPDCLWSMKMPLVLALLVGKWTQCHDYRIRWWRYMLSVILFHRAGTKFSLVTECKPGSIHQIGRIAFVSAFGKQTPESGWRSGRLTGFSRAGLRSSLVVMRAEHVPAEMLP